MKHYTTVLLDADGTLLDFEATQAQALKIVFEKYGYPYNEHIVQRYLDINEVLWKAYEDGHKTREEVIYGRFQILFKELHIEDDGIAFEDEYQRCLGRGHHTIEHAIEVCEQLQKTHDLYIVTNGVTATQYDRLRDSGLDQYFKGIFVSEESSYRKPMKEYFDYCFKRIEHLDVSKTIIIGDSLSSDIQGGINANLATCWFNPKHVRNASQLPIDYEIEDLRELYDILGKDDNDE